jgi:hypothetical protein
MGSSAYFPDYINLTFDPSRNSKHRGSSLDDPQFFSTWDKFGWWLCDDNPDTNPELYGYNHVWLPYCSGDLWSGQKLTPTLLPEPAGYNYTENISVYFSGHLILGAALEVLDDAGLDDADLIIVSGNSAGGIGMWLSIDYINQRYINARVLGVSIAGFYTFSYPYTGPGATDPNNGLADFSQSAWPSNVKLWNSYMNKRCVKNQRAGGWPGSPWACMLANYSYPYVMTPVFIAEALTDSLQLQAHNQLPSPDQWGKDAKAYVNEFAQNMTRALWAVAKLSESGGALATADWPGNAVFAPACFIHDDFTSIAPLIQNVSFKDGLLKWLHDQSSSTKPRIIMDPCASDDVQMCNPSCSTAPTPTPPPPPTPSLPSPTPTPNPSPASRAHHHYGDFPSRVPGLLDEILKIRSGEAEKSTSNTRTSTPASTATQKSATKRRGHESFRERRPSRRKERLEASRQVRSKAPSSARRIDQHGGGRAREGSRASRHLHRGLEDVGPGRVELESEVGGEHEVLLS